MYKSRKMSLNGKNQAGHMFIDPRKVHEMRSHQIDVDVISSMTIPACPRVLSDLREKLADPDGDPVSIGKIVSGDAALSISVLRMVNSPMFGLSRSIESIPQAVSMLGVLKLEMLLQRVLIRQALVFPNVNLTRFWDTADKRSMGMHRLAKELGGVNLELARSFGLFCDIGLPLLMHRFPNYASTLKAANDEPNLPFTEVEFRNHGIDHAQIGAMMAKSWGLSPIVCKSIRRHHDYKIFLDPSETGEPVRLIAMMLITDLAIQRHARLHGGQEWIKGGESALGALLLNDQDLADCIDLLFDEFSATT